MRALNGHMIAPNRSAFALIPMPSLLTPELLRRLEQFQLLEARRVEFVATPALTSALSPRRGRILRRVLSQRQPPVLRQFSPANHPPAATDIATPELSQRVRLLSPLPGGEGQGEGERHTNFYATGRAHGHKLELAIHSSPRILQP